MWVRRKKVATKNLVIVFFKEFIDYNKNELLFPKGISKSMLFVLAEIYNLILKWT